MSRGRVHPKWAAVPLALLCLAGCVTTKTPRQPIGVPLGKAPSSNSGVKAALPPGPVAQPLNTAQTTTSLRVLIKPMGTVPYDGLQLPLLSPDGRLAAVQQGEAPSWPTVLATPGAAPASASQIVVYDLTGNLPVPAPRIDPLPGGVVLGRSANNEGFLVEWPRPDGTRWIGLAPWLGSGVRWLVNSEHVNAHGCLSPAGDLVFTRREFKVAEASLVVQTRSGRVQTVDKGEGSIATPSFTSDGKFIVAFVLSQAGTEITAWPFEAGKLGFPVGKVSARRQLAANADPALAWQSVSAYQHPLIQTESGPYRGFPFFHPVLRRVAEFSTEDASLSLMPAETISSARCAALGAAGAFVTTPKGLRFSPDPPPTPAGQPPAARPPESSVFDAPFVPRTTSSAEHPLILMGPASPQGQPRLGIMVILPEPPEKPPAVK